MVDSAVLADDDASDRRAIIRVRGLRNQFGEHVVHQNLDLDMLHGEILGVVGSSGTGKSVLLRTIVGLQQPTAGSVEVLGRHLLALDPAKRRVLERQFGVLFQGGALFSSLTVLENVALPLVEHIRLNRKDAQRIAAMKLALVGLPAEAGHQLPASLSGGMVKRAALARALALDPGILFLDEPTAGLDPVSAAAFDQLIMTLRDALNLTVMLVTHDLDTLYTVCDRVAVLSRGAVCIADRLDVVERQPDAWIQAYFHGPRGRTARATHAAPNDPSQEPA